MMEFTTLREMEWWIGQVVNAKPGVQFEGPGFFRQYICTVLAGEIAKRGASQLAVPPHIQGYAARMRLWQAIDLQPPKQVKERDPGGRFHPLTAALSEQVAELSASSIRNVFQACGTSDPNTLQAIFIVLSKSSAICSFMPPPAHGCTDGYVLSPGQSSFGPSRCNGRRWHRRSSKSLRQSGEYGALANENAPAFATEFGVTGSLPAPIRV